MEEVTIDPLYSITRHAAVKGGPDAFVTAMRGAAQRAYESAISEGRTPVMVEVIVRVAPKEKAA